MKSLTATSWARSRSSQRSTIRLLKQRQRRKNHRVAKTEQITSLKDERIQETRALGSAARCQMKSSKKLIAKGWLSQLLLCSASQQESRERRASAPPLSAMCLAAAPKPGQ